MSEPKKTKSKTKSKPKPDKREYEEGDDDAAEELPKKRRGRPALSKEEKLAKQVITKEKIIYMIPDEKKGGFKKVKPELGVRDLKKLELQAEKEKKEVELGRHLLSRKNGKIDKRSSTKRTPAQIEATKRMLEANKAKREAAGKMKEANAIVKKAEKKEEMKSAIREVVSEPYYTPKDVTPPDPYANMKF